MIETDRSNYWYQYWTMDSKEIGPLYFSQDHYDGFMK